MDNFYTVKITPNGHLSGWKYDVAVFYNQDREPIWKDNAFWVFTAKRGANAAVRKHKRARRKPRSKATISYTKR